MTALGKMSYEERERRAQAIYDAHIRHLIGPDDADKFVKIDVPSGDYEIGESIRLSSGEYCESGNQAASSALFKATVPAS